MIPGIETRPAYFGDLHYAGGYIVSVGGRPVGERYVDTDLEPARWNPLAGYEQRSTFDYDDVVHGFAAPYLEPDSKHGILIRHLFACDDGIEVPICVDHRHDRHVGWATLEDRDDGVYFHGQLRRGGRVQIGARRGISIGFVCDPPIAKRYYRGRIVELSVVDQHRAAYRGAYLRLLSDLLDQPAA